MKKSINAGISLYTRFILVAYILIYSSVPSFADVQTLLDQYSNALRHHLVWQFLSTPQARAHVGKLAKAHTKPVAEVILEQWRQAKPLDNLERTSSELRRIHDSLAADFARMNSSEKSKAVRQALLQLPLGKEALPVRLGYESLLESLRSGLLYQTNQEGIASDGTLQLLDETLAGIRAEGRGASRSEENRLLQQWFGRFCVWIEPSESEGRSPVFILSSSGTKALNYGKNSAKVIPTENAIPKKFLWGVSTSSQQWEGKTHGGIWETFADAGRTEEKIKRAANGIEMYEKDLDLAAGMGLNAFRTSIEWSRIEPEPGRIDPEGVKFYHRLFSGMRKRGLEPVVTLIHFTWPQWLEKIGGWESEAGIRAFCRFVDFVSSEYGSKVDFWLTYNEPPISIIAGYVLGSCAPGYKNPLKAIAVARSWIRCHKLAYNIIHENDRKAYVSWNNYTGTYKIGDFWGIHLLVEGSGRQIGSESTTTLEALTAVDKQWTDMMTGADEAQTLGVGGRSKYIDYIGIDYYALWRLPQAFTKPHLWEIHPEGLYDVIKNYYNYFKVPVLIAENGMATCDLAPRPDGWTREAFLVQHVKEMQRAIRDGYPVLGYIHWSITDNWEWGSFAPRFGLYSVDCRNERFERVPTPSVDVFRKIVQAGGVTPELEALYPSPSSSGATGKK